MTDRATAILKAKHHAIELSHAASAAYWVGSKTEKRADFLEGKMHESFADIAKALGYEIKKKEEGE